MWCLLGIWGILHCLLLKGVEGFGCVLVQGHSFGLGGRGDLCGMCLELQMGVCCSEQLVQWEVPVFGELLAVLEGLIPGCMKSALGVGGVSVCHQIGLDFPFM